MFICPVCSNENLDRSTFCVKCGNKIELSERTERLMSTTPKRPLSQPGIMGVEQARSFPQQSQPPVSHYLSSDGWITPPPPPVANTNNPPPPSYTQPVMPPTSSVGSFPTRAFAGRGTPIAHQSWLLDGRESQATRLLTTIYTMLSQRQEQGLKVKQEKLTEHGIGAEQRNYLTVGYRNATILIYASPTPGNDLYISRTTTVTTELSLVRTVISASLLFGLIIAPILSQILISKNISSPQAIIAGIIFALAYLPVLTFLLVLVVRSIINGLIARDFLIYLRSDTLDDFQVDTVAILEHTIDRVIRNAVRQMGLESSQITPPVLGYQVKRKIRWL